MKYGFVERVACPGCGSASAETRWQSPWTYPPLRRLIEAFYGLDVTCLDALYRLDRCECGLVFQRFIGDERTLTQLYTCWAHGSADDPLIHADLADPFGSRDAHELMSAAAYLSKPLSQMRVLDYGAGFGLWVTVARTLGCQVSAIELSERKRIDGITYISEDDVSGFDFINMEQVIEHVPEPLNLVRKLSLGLNGVLKLAMPDASNADQIVRKLRDGSITQNELVPLYPLEHINGFTRASLLAMLDKAEMHIVRPSLRQGYAFIPRALPKGFKRLAKELIRPIWRPPIYVWCARR